MLHKYRYLILNTLLIVAIVILCLFAPELLLAMEKSSDTGNVQHGANEYYADDVSDAGSQGFNFQRRLMMLSGKWKSEREVVPEDGRLLSERDLRRICVSIPALLMQQVDWMGGNGTVWYDLMWEKIAIAQGYDTYDLFENDNRAQDYDEENGVRTYGEVPESRARTEDGGVPTDINMDYAALFDKGTAVLYKYSDSIFDVNNFYMWDYTLESEDLDIIYNLKIDAVTLDIYSISIHGGKLSSLGWNDIFNGALQFARENDAVRIDELNKFLNFEVYESTLLFPFSVSAQMYKEYQNWTINGARGYKDGPQGYTFENGNFLSNVDSPQFYADNIAELQSGSQTIYACTLVEGGYDFFYTDDEVRARMATANPFYP